MNWQLLFLALYAVAIIVGIVMLNVWYRNERVKMSQAECDREETEMSIW
jgi:hypothetical protein